MTANEDTCFDVNGSEEYQNRFDNETYVKHLKENGISEDDDVVSYRSAESKGKIVISHCLCACIVISVLIIVICVGLIVGLVGRSPDCNASNSNTGVIDGHNYNTSITTTTIDPSLPWGGIKLPPTLIPHFYNLTLKVDLETFMFTGSVAIKIEVNKTTPYVIVHVHQLAIVPDSVSVVTNDGVRLHVDDQFEVKSRQFYVLRLRESLSRGSKYTVQFNNFTGPLQTDLRGLYRSSYKDGDNERVVASSQLQSIDARKVFPCFDEPALKATFSVAIIHRRGYTALSNMPASKTTDVANGWLRQEFSTTPRMSTYLLGFVVSDYKSRKSTLSNGLEIRIWSPERQFRQSEFALQVAVKAYPFFENFFDIPEVVPKADHVAVPEFSAAAMENWGIVLYRESALLYDEEVSPISSKHHVAIVMCHEIAHTWFGNMVTMKWWDDLWLNEAFASTLMYFATDALYPSWGSFDLQVTDEIIQVYIRDALLESHPISTPIKDPDDIHQLFDEISYFKGMAVLRLLQGFVGDDVFRDALRSYVKTYKYKNTEKGQLWAKFTEAANHKYDIEEVMGSWTLQMGYPVVMVKSLGNGKYSLDQSRFLLNPNDKSDPSKSPYEYRWHIPFTYQTSNGHHDTAWLHRTSAEISVGDASWIVGNINKTGFFLVNYEQNTWTAIIKQLGQDHVVFDRSTRVGLINDAYLLARAGHIDYSVAFNLTTYMMKEKDYVPWKSLAHSLEFLDDMLSTADSFGHYQSFLKTLVSKVFREIGTSTTGTLPERFLKRLVLKFACRTGVPEAVAYAKTLFSTWMKYDTRVPADYSLIIYSMGIREGGQKEWDFLWNKYMASNIASEREVMMEALAQAREPWLLWRYIRRTFDANLIRLQDAALVFKYLSKNPLGRNIALQFMKEHWIAINTHFGTDGFIVREIVFQITSKLNSQYDLIELESLYKRYPTVGVAEREAQNGLALIRSNIKWLEKNRHPIAEWLSNYLGVEYH